MTIKAAPISRGYNAAAGGNPLAAKPAPNKTDIKTKGELERLKSRREKPAPVLQLTPATHRMTEMKRQTSNQNERRIAVLKEGLHSAGQKMNTQHRLSVLKGQTQKTFNHKSPTKKEREHER